MSVVEVVRSEPTTGWVPLAARARWLTLAGLLEELPPVPCRTTTDAEAWWPDRRNLHSAATHAAVAGCRRCPAQAPCLAYALAADEPSGVWGGVLPEERRRMTRRW